MSDEGKVQREWRFYLDDMATFAKKVLTYTQDLTQTEFVANELAYSEYRSLTDNVVQPGDTF